MWMRTNGVDRGEDEDLPELENFEDKNTQYIFVCEFKYLQHIFSKDAKNYHAWSHQIWLVERYWFWAEPALMPMVEELLDQDVRNNSAWSFRYFLVMRTADLEARKGGEGFGVKLVENEIKYVMMKRLSSDWHNEAAWAYIRGMLAVTNEEAAYSMQTNARRIYMGDLKWMNAKLLEWGQIAKHEEFSDELIQQTDGDDSDS